MNTATLTKEKIHSIVKRAEGISSDSHEQVFWEAGAISEATRAQPLVQALEKFISMHETGLLPDRFTYEAAKKSITEYNKQP